MSKSKGEFYEKNNIYFRDGVIGMGGINGPNGPYENNIRPAFCLPADTPITLSQDIIDGQEVYIIMY